MSQNKSGYYCGLRARIEEESLTAEFIRCSGHSLNFVGQVTANCCKKSMDFWSFLQSSFIF